MNKITLIETLKYIIKSSKSKEEAFKKTDELFNEILTKDDLIEIVINFLQDSDDKKLDEEIDFDSELKEFKEPNLKIIH